MSIEIKKLRADPKKLPPIKALIYGDPGCGKTFLAASAQDVPEMADVLVLDCDRGSNTLTSRGDVSAAVTKLPKDVEEVLWLLTANDPSVASIKTVIIDNISELQRADLAEIADTEADKKKTRDRDSSELSDYKKNKSRMLRVLRMARDLEGRNVIMTAWATKVFPKIPGTNQANKDAMPTQISPDIGNAILPTLLGFVDFVLYLFAHEGSRYLVTSNYNNVTAKCRDSAIAALLCTEKEGKKVPYIVNPTIRDIQTSIKSAYVLDPKTTTQESK